MVPVNFWVFSISFIFNLFCHFCIYIMHEVSVFAKKVLEMLGMVSLIYLSQSVGPQAGPTFDEVVKFIAILI